MNAKWPTVRLGEVLKQRKEFISIQDLENYKRPRVQLHAKGIVLRDEVEGALIKTKQQQICHSGEFLVAEIDAKVGGFGIVPSALDGAIVSSHYFLFVVDKVKVDLGFLDYFIHTPGFYDQVSAQGSTNYAAIRPTDVLEYKIPLPPIAEQQRIVAHIKQLVTHIQEAQTLRQQASEETASLISASNARLFKPKLGWSIMRIGEFCEHPQYGYTESASNKAVGPHFLRITDIQNGQVDWSRVPYCHCPDPSKYLLKPGDLIFTRTGATTGKSFLIQHCPEAVFASYLIRLRVRERVSVEYLYHYFQSPSYWEQITDKKIGTGQPNLNGTKLEKLMVPIPPLDEQNQIVAEVYELNAKVNELKHMQAETAAELEAILPSILDRAFKGEL